MHNLDPIWLTFAGFGGGLVGSMAGLASLVSYPALLAVGLSPVSANVTNTVALVFTSAGSILGSKTELRDRMGHIKWLAPTAIAGGITGSLLLLALPSKSFTLVVPVLIGLTALGATRRARRSPRRTRRVGCSRSGYSLLASTAGTSAPLQAC